MGHGEFASTNPFAKVLFRVRPARAANISAHLRQQPAFVFTPSQVVFSSQQPGGVFEREFFTPVLLQEVVWPGARPQDPRPSIITVTAGR